MTDRKYVDIDSDDELKSVGGLRKVITMEPDVPLDVIMRGLAVVERVNQQSEAFESVQIVVMMPEEFKDEEGYDEEFALSISGNAAKQAAVHFRDNEKFNETGEVWLSKKWLNKRCRIMYTLVSRPGDEERGYNPYTKLYVSKGRESKRTDLPNTFAPCAGYQQDREDDDGGQEYVI